MKRTLEKIALGTGVLIGLIILAGYVTPQNLGFLQFASAQPSPDSSPEPQSSLEFVAPIPAWIKNDTKLWSQNETGDNAFVLGIRYLVANNIMPIPSNYDNSAGIKPIPAWVKKTAFWWTGGYISDYEFISNMEYLVTHKIINLSHGGNATLAQDSLILENNFPKGRIKVGNITLDVQVADTPDRMTEGLQFQQPLPYSQGMIFVFVQPQVVAMWMKDMQFPLDMIWFESNGNIVHIEKNLPPCSSDSPCQVYDGGNQDAKYVLEVTAGFSDRLGITEKSKLTILQLPNEQ